MAEGDFNIKAIISAETSKFESGLKKGQVSLNDFGSVIEKILGPNGKVVLAVAGVTTAFMKMGQAMNASMAEIAKGTGATGEKLYQLRENVHDALSVGVGRSAKEVGKMVADLNTRFKVTGNELVNLTEEFDNFSNVAGMETSTAINLTADVMAKWNIETKDTNKLLDQLTVASQESGASVETLLNNLKSGQAIFSQFGMSATDTIAFVGALKENGIEASNALIGMRTALAKFSQEGKNASTAFSEVSEKIKNASSETEALNIAVETFGARSGAEMVKVLRDGSTSAEEFKNKLLEAGGAVAETDKWSRTSKDAFEDLTASFIGTFGGLFEGVDSLMKGVFDSISEILRTLDPILRPIINIVRDVLSTIGELLSELFRNIKQLNEEYNVAFQTIANVTQTVYEIIHGILGNLLEAFKTTFSLIFAILGGKWELAWEYTKKILMLAAKNILDTVSSLINLLSENINLFIENIINPVIDGINKVRELIGQPLIERFQPIGKINLSQITGLEKQLEKTNKKIQDLSGETEKKITGDLGKVEKKVYSVSSQTEKKVEKESKKTALSIGEAFNKIAEGIKFNAEDWSDVVNSSFSAITDAGTEMLSQIGEGLSEGSLSYEDFSATAVEALSQVLQALAAQLAATAALRAANYDYGSAAIAAAGATAALVASGALAGVARSMKSTAKESESAANQINNVSNAAKNSLLSLDDFISRLNDIRKSFEKGTVGGLAQNMIETRKLYEESSKTLSKYQDDYNKVLEQYNNIVGQIYSKYDFSRGQTMLYNDQETIKTWKSLLDSAYYTVETYRKKIQELKSDMASASRESLKAIQDEVQTNKSLVGVYDDIYRGILKAQDVQKRLNDLEERAERSKSYKGSSSYSFEKNKLAKQYNEYMQYYQLQLNEQLSYVQSLITSTYSEMSQSGLKIGDTFISSILNGMTKKDFMKELKSYFRSMLLKITVLTEDFQNKLSELGTNLSTALVNGGKGIENIVSQISSLWDATQTKVKSVDSVINKAFGDISDSIENAENSLTSFEEAMNSFFDSINDLGGEIADGIISGLENGLDQGNFLDSMKEWIRKLLIQTVVYTDAMKSEIEAVGKAISSGLTKGFTETSLHEIRRDLSYIFNEANKTMGNVDSVLNTVFGGYATGTQNAMAGIHLVGESGPELVRFRGGEQVLNAQNTQAALEGAGGTTNNFNVTFNNLQDTSAYAMMNQLRAYNREMAINGVI